MNRNQIKKSFFAFLLVLSALVTLGNAQLLPTGTRGATRSRTPFPYYFTNATFRSVQRVGAVGMTVSNMDAAVDFYSRVLTFEKVSDQELAGKKYEQLEGVEGLRMRVVTMRLGTEMIELTQYLAPMGQPFPADAKSNDRNFQHIAIIVSDMNKAYAQLQANNVVAASVAPQELPGWNKQAAGIKAYYFRDPDGHYLEILQFPAGKGDARWQHASNRLFLGIDHTAIVVRNTDESLRFYRDVLNFKVAGTSHNYGVEQERLNSVAGAHLRITSLRPENGGLGIEFLEYVTPTDGRPAPETPANDLVHWQTRLELPNLEGIVPQLLRRGYRLISKGLVPLPDEKLGFRRGLLVRDPDNHVLELVEVRRGR
jgi:catechol 2,3-dioxygenase-like lactoylglutathione lyase family enzyme